MTYRLHVVSLPHTQTTAAYSNCAFASLARGFASMMTSLGHEVIVYSGEDNDAPCAEHVPLITKAEQAEFFNVRGPEDILKEPFVHHTYEPERWWWSDWNARAIRAIGPRVQRRDFICIIGGGVLFEPLISAFANVAMPIEYAIGYAGTAARTWHAFGSSNWAHVVFGLFPARYPGWRGRAMDRVIPHYFNPDEFEPRVNKSDYLLYLGKLKEDKGVQVASRAAELTGNRIIFAGQGPTPIPYGEVLNRRVGPDERRELLAGARAVFVPSLYVEPFGMIAAEALLSATPIITTPWGGLGEINIDGVTGYHCRTFPDFLNAVRDIDRIDPAVCGVSGFDRFAYDNVRHQYQRWLDDLYTLWGRGVMEGWDGDVPSVAAATESMGLPI